MQTTLAFQALDTFVQSELSSNNLSHVQLALRMPRLLHRLH